MSQLKAQSKHELTSKPASTSRQSKKIDKKTTYAKSNPVFRIRPDGSEKGIIKYVGIINENDKLGDEIVELDKPIHPNHEIVGRDAIPIKKIDSFDMIGRIYRCNIVGSHIVASRRYPVMYLDIGYERTMVTGSLMQIFFSLDMNIEDKKAIEHAKRYVNLTYNGKWFRHTDCDEEMTSNYEKMVTDMLEHDAATIFYTSTDPVIISNRFTFTDNDITEWIDAYVEREKQFYDNLVKESQIEFRSITKLRDWFVELCQSDKFVKFLTIAMKCREIHRRKEKGFDEDDTVYVVPKNIIKLDDVKQKMIDNDELILEDD